MMWTLKNCMFHVRGPVAITDLILKVELWCKQIYERFYTSVAPLKNTWSFIHMIFTLIFPIITFIVWGSMGLYDCTCLRSRNFNNCWHSHRHQTHQTEGDGWYVECVSVHLCQFKCVFLYCGWIENDGSETLQIYEFRQLSFVYRYAWCPNSKLNKKVSNQDGTTLKDQAWNIRDLVNFSSLCPEGKGCQGFLVYKVREPVRENKSCFVFNCKQAFVTPLTAVFIMTNKKILN